MLTESSRLPEVTDAGTWGDARARRFLFGLGESVLFSCSDSSSV